MRILQIFNQYRFRGGEEAWVESVEKLAGDFADVSELRYLSTDWMDGRGPSRWQQARLMGNNPEAGNILEAKVRIERPDVCLFHNVIPVASLGIYKRAQSLRVPIIQYIHNFRPFSPSGTLWVGNQVNPAALSGNLWPEILHGGWQGSRMKTLVLAWHLKRALDSGLLARIDHWISPSHFMKEYFVKAGVPKERITVVPHCYLGNARSSPAPEGDYYLYLGRLEADKGVLLLLDAWTRLAGKTGEKVPKLKIAGTGSLEARVRHFARSNVNVEYLGHVTGNIKQELIDHCRAMVIPSICWESLGLTAYEAYASCRPVIASRAGALQETVMDGKTGWLFQPGDRGNLVEALLSAELARTEVRESRGVAGREWLAKHASPDQWRTAFFNICEQVTEISRNSQ